MRKLSVLLVIAICTASVLASSEKPLTNADVVALAKADLGDDVVIEKIGSAAEVHFDTSTDGLIALRKQGISKAVIAAMLKRSAPASSGERSTSTSTRASDKPRSETAGSWTVRLICADEKYDLTKMLGTIDNNPLRFGVRYDNFAGAQARTRIHDCAPEIWIASESQPGGNYFIVQADSNPKKSQRSVKIGHGLMGMVDSNSPDPDSVVKYDTTEAGHGLWKLKIQNPLKRGEYGVFVVNSNILGASEMYDFGVD